MANRIVMVLAAVLSLLPLCPCEAEMEAAGVVRALRQAKNETEMDQAVNEFNREQIDLVNDLVDLLENSKLSTEKVRACYLLGSLGNPRATGALVENLLLTTGVEEESRIHLWGAYPCQEALAKIGKPAEWRLIETLTGTASDEVKAAALKVIQTIEGWRGAVFVLEQAWEKAGLEERKQLEKALERARKDAGN